MGLFSSLRKNKQADQHASAADDSAYSPREDKMTDRRPAPNRRSRKPGTRQGIDPVLPEKKRARRRLVGAIALIVAAIIVVPMVFDSEPKPLATDIAVNIPSREPAPADKAAATTAPDTSEASDAAQERTPDFQGGADMPSLPTGQTPATNPAVPALPPSATPPPLMPAPAPVLPAAPQPEKPLPAPKPVPAPVKPKPAAPAMDEYSRAQAILSGKIDSLPPPPPKEAAPSSSKFVVQVAALSSEEKAKELQDQLKAAGIQSYTQRISTGSGLRIRVRVGPFSSRDEADRMLGRVSQLGLGGSVVPA